MSNHYVSFFSAIQTIPSWGFSRYTASSGVRLLRESGSMLVDLRWTILLASASMMLTCAHHMVMCVCVFLF